MNRVLRAATVGYWIAEGLYYADSVGIEGSNTPVYRLDRQILEPKSGYFARIEWALDNQRPARAAGGQKYPVPDRVVSAAWLKVRV